MIVTSNTQTSIINQPQTPSDDSGQLRPNVISGSTATTAANVQLRRSDSNKTGTHPNTTRSNNINVQMPNNMNNVINNSNNKSNNRTTQLQNNAEPTSMTTGSSPIVVNNRQQIQNEELSVLTGYYACSRYFLFLVYILLLVSLIMNTFLHFIFYGSNMSIGSMFFDAHHRKELINGEYYSLDVYLTENYFSRNNIPHDHHKFNQFASVNNYHSDQLIHCDRSSFLSLLDEFYHQYPVPKPQPPTYDAVNRSSASNRNNLPNNNNNNNPSKSYPKIFANFNSYARSKDRDDINEDDIYYSSSSTSIDEPEESLKASRISTEDRNHRHHHNNNNHRDENRLLIIEVIALILLFVTVLNQVLGLVGVIKKHLFLLIFVTIVDSLLFCILVFISNIGLILLLLLATCGGYLFIFQLKIGLRRRIKERLRLKEDISAEVQEAIMQIRNRMSPCIHVSMEQYEAMTQQMLHRYSSPIVYCPHYNESLC